MSSLSEPQPQNKQSELAKDMPPRSSRGHRKERKTNVFVQQDQPTAEDFEDEPDEVEDGSGSAVATATGSSGARARRARAQRASRQAKVRSEVFTRTLGSEMRKVGMLSGVIVVTLGVLTFVLN